MKPTTLADLTNLSDQLWKAQERDSMLTQDNLRLRSALSRIVTLAERTIMECDPPVNFIAEIQDAAKLALTR